MRRPSMYKSEWKFIWKNRHLRIAVSVLLIIPLLYAGMFLSGYWNPYGKLDKLPVAVVNEDEGAAINGKMLRIGDDLTQELKQKPDLDFRFVGRKEAEARLRDGKYYLSIIIPQDFSRHAATLNDTEPQPAQLVYQTNEGYNFVAGQIGSNAVKELKDQVSAKLIKTYTSTVFDRMAELSDGLGKAGEGASSLSRGAVSAQAGADKLQAGIDHLNAGAYKLSDGLAPLQQGLAKLTQGGRTLQSGASALAGGLSQLGEAEGKLQQQEQSWDGRFGGLAEGVQSSAKTAAEASAKAASLEELLKQYAKDHPDLAEDTAFQAIVEGGKTQASAAASAAEQAGALAKNADALQSMRSVLTDGQMKAADKLATAADRGEALAAATEKLSDGLGQWDQGFTAFAGGLRSLADGSRALDSGAADLAGGFTKLVNGTHELESKLTDAAQRTAGIHASDAMLDMYAQPVQLTEQKMAAVPNYGTGAVPYFLALGLLVGGLLACNIIPFIRPVPFEVKGWSFFTGKLGLFYTVSLLQTLVVDAMLLWGFGIRVVSVPKLLLFSVLVAWMFVTMILMLVALIGGLGRLVGIFMVVTQLATSGGTFPMEMAPTWIQAIGRCLPMTYALRGFHAVVSTGNWPMFWRETGIVAAYLCGFAAVMLLRVLILSGRGKLNPVPVSAAAH